MAHAFRPITVSFTPVARRELNAFVASVYRGDWGDGLVPIVSLEPSGFHAHEPARAKTGFVLGATDLDHHHRACVLVRPRLASLDGMAFLLKLPAQASVLDRVDFDWRDGRLLAQN
ncbi:hypothetical protein M2323_001667 [Rhodoblastus acidophilus]|uniref:hypothetical protein n=1 Tax=Rhodoblastus acidophilus TaxID=1074 RepID=UPI00160BC1AC|nr:hypothetical protein [Rhodoblastus acidophilus]MCW2284054.1 hypothetical protein [Rhodoblastus acidophilus]MCW2332750.1 hypothetical protein [Rhodoblastus acidophilus]